MVVNIRKIIILVAFFSVLSCFQPMAAYGGIKDATTSDIYQNMDDNSGGLYEAMNGASGDSISTLDYLYAMYLGIRAYSVYIVLFTVFICMIVAAFAKKSKSIRRKAIMAIFIVIGIVVFLIFGLGIVCGLLGA